MSFRWTPAVLTTLALGGTAFVQTASPAPEPSADIPAATAPRPCCLVPGGTLVDIQLVDPISSRLQHRGDTFAIRLGTALVIDGATVLPAGVAGVGEVIDAAPARAGGAPGKILLAARFLDWNGTRIALRGFRLGGSGTSKAGAALGTSLVAGPLAMFVHGGEIEWPAGTWGQAKIAVDSPMAPLPASPLPPASPEAPASTPSAASTAPPAPAGHTTPPAASGLSASPPDASSSPDASPSNPTHQE